MDIAGAVLLAMLIVMGALIALLWLISRVVQDGRRISELQARIIHLEVTLQKAIRDSLAQPPSQPTATEPKPTAAPAPAPAAEPTPLALHVKKTTPPEFVAAREEVFPPPPEIPTSVEPPPPISEPAPSPEPAPDPLETSKTLPWRFAPPRKEAFSRPPEISKTAEPPPPIAATQPAFKAGEPAPAPGTPATPPEKGSFEMRLGTYWLVRIGAVMLLTGLVFFGNLAYHNFILKLGPAGKIGLLYLASFALLGAGTWWLRKATREALKNYGQVIFATGLAAVYFTTYVAHHIPALQVIQSPLVDGALLLAWAGFIVWIADRKKSEVLALFAVVLAYYTSVITTVGAFTLYSNLVLTAVAVVFLVRNRWAGLTFASLIATYVGYAFWRFFHHGEWHWATPDEGLWFGIYFLAGYWLMFTAAGFLSKNEKYAGKDRAAFLTLNNGAFFALFILTMLQVNTGGFWKFALAYGTVLLVLAELSRRFLPGEPPTKNAYLTQGLLLVTLGFIFKYAGLKLALVLGAESVVLYVMGTQRQSLVLKLFSYASAGMAVGWALTDFKHFDPKGIWMGSGLGALMTVNAIWAHRNQKEDKNHLRPAPTFFSALALIAWGATTWFNTHEETLPLVFAVEAALFTFSIYLFRVREITLLGQLFLAMANGDWIARYFNQAPLPPWWNPLILLAITLGLSHWWQKQKIVADDKRIGFGCQAIYALAIVGVLYGWLQALASVPDWLALTSLLAVVVTAYGVYTRAWALAICGQLFLVISLCQFVFQVLDNKPLWYFPLAPIVALGLLSFATMRWFAAKPDSKAGIRDPLLKFAMAYRWVALVLSLCWIQQYINERERVWAFMAVGAAVFGLAGWRRSFEAVAFGAVYSLAALGNFWALDGDRLIYLPNLLAILALLCQQQIARRLPARYVPQENLHVATMLVGCLTLWRFISCWVMQVTPEQNGSYFPSSWSALALIFFAAGVLLKEPVYHWTGLAVLAAAFGKLWLSPEQEWLKLLNLLPVLLLLAHQQLDRRSSKRFVAAGNIDAVKIVVGSVTLWRYVSCWVMQSQSGFYLTASWSVLAFGLFAAGILLSERVYRWAGLGILAAALGRVVLYDVWKQETIYRVLTFMALGVVLLALGFLYNKYQDKIRKWM